MPDILSHVIGSHHRPGAVEEVQNVVHLIHLSNECAKQIGFAFVEKKGEFAVSQLTMDKIGLDAEGILAALKEIGNTARSQVTDTFSAIFS